MGRNRIEEALGAFGAALAIGVHARGLGGGISNQAYVERITSTAEALPTAQEGDVVLPHATD